MQFFGTNHGVFYRFSSRYVAACFLFLCPCVLFFVCSIVAFWSRSPCARPAPVMLARRPICRATASQGRVCLVSPFVLYYCVPVHSGEHSCDAHQSNWCTAPTTSIPGPTPVAPTAPAARLHRWCPLPWQRACRRHRLSPLDQGRFRLVLRGSHHRPPCLLEFLQCL